MPNTLDTLSDEGVQLAELESRLIDEYGSARRDAIHTTLEQERGRFANARIHAFVPILVERSVRARLRSAA